MSEEWKKFTAKDKKKYEDMAAKDKIWYEKEKSNKAGSGSNSESDDKESVTNEGE